MSASLKKPPSQDRPSPSQRNPSSPGQSPARSPSRASTPATSTSNGVARSRSVRGAHSSPVSARAAVKKPGAPSGLSSTQTALTTPEEEDAQIEHSALVEELKEQLERIERASEEYQKQVVVLQSRLDDALVAQGTLEERVHEEEEKVEMLGNEKRESQRQRNELERIYEAERVSIMKDREDSQAREEELQEVIQRLKGNLSQQNSLRPGMDEDGRLPRQASLGSPNADGGNFAPPNIQRSNSRNNSKLLLQKDKVIESLRLEIAEMQFKIVEMGNMGGSKVHEVEKALMETRMANARLMEENESFQVLLSERTLNGDFSPAVARLDERTPPRTKPSTSLADELESVSPSEEPSPRERKLEGELADAKDQNKALTLYINKIIERLLQHQGYEAVLSNTQEGPHGSGAAADKDLPPLPPPKDNKDDDQQSFLQRATSVVRRQRPQTMMPPGPSKNEDPKTAPSIPLKPNAVPQNKRSSVPVGMALPPQSQTQRTPSGNVIPAAAGIISNMYKPPSDQMSPSLASPTRTSTSFFNFNAAANSTAAAARTPSIFQATSGPTDDGGRQAALDALTGGDSNTAPTDAPSPPRSIASSQDRSAQVMAGNKMRPLRLLQQNPEAAAAEEARLKNNRQSWIGGMTGWFSKNPQQQAQAQANTDQSMPPPQMAPLRRDTSQASELSQSSIGAERRQSGMSRTASWNDDRKDSDVS